MNNLVEKNLFNFVDEEHEDDVYKIFTEKNLKEKLPKLFIETSPFKPNKPGPKAKVVDSVIIANKFGSISLTGKELVIFDEDITLAILSTKKQISGGDFYFVTSLRELAKLTGTTWRGAKIDKKSGIVQGNSTPKQILQSLQRLWETGIVFNNKELGRTLRFRILDALDTPNIDDNGNIVFEQGERDQVRVKVSKEFLFLYSIYKDYTIKLSDRIAIKDLIGKAIYRYIKYLTTFKYKGIHTERLELLITKINWELPTRTRKVENQDDKIFIRWEDVKRQLSNANKGLLNVNVSLEYPSKLSLDSIITIKNTTFHQTTLDV